MSQGLCLELLPQPLPQLPPQQRQPPRRRPLLCRGGLAEECADQLLRTSEKRKSDQYCGFVRLKSLNLVNLGRAHNHFIVLVNLLKPLVLE